MNMGISMDKETDLGMDMQDICMNMKIDTCMAMCIST